MLSLVSFSAHPCILDARSLVSSRLVSSLGVEVRFRALVSFCELLGDINQSDASYLGTSRDCLNPGGLLSARIGSSLEVNLNLAGPTLFVYHFCFLLQVPITPFGYRGKIPIVK